MILILHLFFRILVWNEYVDTLLVVAAAAAVEADVMTDACFVEDALMELLRRTTIHFVHCVLPQHNAGLCDLKISATQSAGDVKTGTRDDVMLNVPLVRAQIRGAQLVDAVRLHRQGRRCVGFL